MSENAKVWPSGNGLRSSVGRASHWIPGVAGSIPSRKARTCIFATGPGWVLKSRYLGTRDFSSSELFTYNKQSSESAMFLYIYLCIYLYIYICIYIYIYIYVSSRCVGVMAGSHYSHHGGGSNYLCLPLNPIYEIFKDGNQGSTYIYGTEYEISSQSNIFPTNLHDHDAPCAVCHTELRGSHVMIPARNICPDGWTLEYKGYLMAGHHGHKGRAQFICVDDDPAPTWRGHVGQDGALLYFVESHCGSLPCGPYIQGQELTCAVCTK